MYTVRCYLQHLFVAVKIALCGPVADDTEVAVAVGVGVGAGDGVDSAVDDAVGVNDDVDEEVGVGANADVGVADGVSVILVSSSIVGLVNWFNAS